MEMLLDKFSPDEVKENKPSKKNRRTDTMGLLYVIWEGDMSRRCQVTGKKPRRGKSYSIRGIAKKQKGIGLNVTGTVKRRFLPNLFKKRFWFPEEKRFITLKLSAHAMRTIDKLGLAAIVKKLRARGEKI